MCVCVMLEAHCMWFMRDIDANCVGRALVA